MGACACTQNKTSQSAGVAKPPIYAGQRAFAPLTRDESIPLQTKLTVGAANDRYEQEADRVADQVMRMPLDNASTLSVPVKIQRLCTECEDELQRQVEEEEEEELLQAKAERDGVANVTPDVATQVHALRGGGQPLPESTRAFFEPRLGHDLSQVRVHTDLYASESAKALNALAYTVGRHIAFADQQYVPGSRAGRRLIAHELVHTIQQSGGKQMLQRYVTCESGPQCPARERGEVRRSRTGPMEVGSISNGISGNLVANFAVGEGAVKADLGSNRTWNDILRQMVGNPNQHWEILGFSDCQGSVAGNTRIRGQRANAIHGVLPAAARRQVDSVATAPLNDCIRPNLNERDRAYNRSAVILFKRTVIRFPGEQVRVPPPFPVPTTEDCLPWRTRMLTRHLNAARTWMNDAEPKVSAYRRGVAAAGLRAVVRRTLTDNFHTTAAADVVQIADGFASLRRELNRALTFECEDDGCADQAYVRGLFSWIRRLGDIHVCPPWFRCADYFRRVTTLIHERAHQYPGATDNAYEWQPDYARLSASDAIDNADSYAVAARQIYHGGRRGPGIPAC